MSLPILALAFATFAIGTTEFIIMGILPELAHALSVSIPATGLLVSGYALGVAAGAPVLAMATSQIPRKAALLLLMSIFIVGNSWCALAPDYNWLMVARVFTSFAHGAFFGIGSVVAASLVPQAQRASAIALMFAGLALANVLGVPLGTLIGQTHGWRAAFWSVSLAGVLSASLLAVLLPSCGKGDALDWRRELGVLARAQVWLALVMTVLGFGGVFVVFTYITPILVQKSGFASTSVTWLLVLFGSGLAVGNWIGGKLADRDGAHALLWLFAALVVVMAVFTQTMLARDSAAITLFVWGVVAFATVPGLQMQVMRQAADAPNLAATLNIGAFNVGNALGAWLGGVALSSGARFDTLPWLAALMTLGAIGVAFAAKRLAVTVPATAR
jgi:DHA1 family inner membrane transport protein